MSLLSVLALIAVVMRGFVAEGYMIAPPASHTEGSLVILCNGAAGGPGHQLVMDTLTGDVIDLDSPQHSDNDQNGSDAQCAFAMSSHIQAQMLVETTLLQSDFTSDRVSSELVSAPGRGLPAPPPPARGPPNFI